MTKESKKPWTGEPDEESGSVSGVKYELERHPRMLHWCGYVLVSYGHPWYGLEYNQLAHVKVHGGVTFADYDAVYWKIGFDCAHAGDLLPGVMETGTYRDIDYARGQVARLCEQAARATPYVRA